MLRAARESCATVSAACTYKDNNTIPLSVDLVSLQLAGSSPQGAIESALVRYWIQQKMPGAMQQSSSPVILAIFQEVSYHCYIIQPLSLRQERMALKLISARLQLVLLHAKRSGVVMYFYCKRRGSKKARCEVFVSLS